MTTLRVWHVHDKVNVIGLGGIDLLRCCCGRASTAGLTLQDFSLNFPLSRIGVKILLSTSIGPDDQCRISANVKRSQIESCTSSQGRRNSGPCALNLLWGPSSVGVGVYMICNPKMSNNIWGDGSYRLQLE